MSKSIAIAHVTILESLRRKDPYVVLILGLALMIGAGIFAKFGIEGLGKFVKDVGFTVINLMCSVICVVAAARQFPSEIENRTLQPLVAKPVSRMMVYLGKYVGVSAMASCVVLLFFAELFTLLTVMHIPTGAVFAQALFLRVLSMWVIAAFVLAMSLVLTHGANVTICLLLTLAMSTFSNTLLTVHSSATGVARWILELVYWVVPHLELFDLSKKVVHEWPAVSWGVLGAMTLYAVLYAGIFLALGSWRFRRQPL
ncbi:MAG: ABC transporter permease subunit [bacterium]|nr:ABC transporter permease subunit [bacterium]